MARNEPLLCSAVHSITHHLEAAPVSNWRSAPSGMRRKNWQETGGKVALTLHKCLHLAANWNKVFVSQISLLLSLSVLLATAHWLSIQTKYTVWPKSFQPSYKNDKFASPNFFSINLNQIRWRWSWREHILRNVETYYPTRSNNREDHNLDSIRFDNPKCMCYISTYKVKWSRYRPGVAQRVGRGIALLFHDRGTRRGWVVSSRPRPHFTPGKDPVPILQEAGWAPGSVWTGGKYCPHRDLIRGRRC